MRKLHELLPLARQYLIDVNTRGAWFSGAARLSPYVCNAADIAREVGLMTAEEAATLAEAVLAEISLQSRGRCDMLYSLIAQRQGIPVLTSQHRDYFPHRDLWLDEFQLKLERTKQ